MSKDTVAVQLDREAASALDAAADSLGADRSDAIRAALAALDAERRILEGLKQAQTGEFASDAEVARAFRRKPR